LCCKTARPKTKTEGVRHTNFDPQETWLRSGEHSSILCSSLESAATIENQEHKQPPLLVNPTFVGRPGLDPGTLGLKVTCDWLLCVGLVAHVYCFQGIALF